jgi:hypothetical protein
MADLRVVDSQPLPQASPGGRQLSVVDSQPLDQHGKPYVQQPEGGGGERFLGNLWDKSIGGLASFGKGVADLAVQGTRAATGQAVTPGPGTEMLQGIAAGHLDQARKVAKSVSRGMEAIRAGDRSGAVNHFIEAHGHALATAIPLVGPAAAAIGEQAGGEEGRLDKYGNVVTPVKAPDIAGAAGGATGLIGSTVAPAVAGKVASRAVRGAADLVKVRNTLNPVEQSAVNFLDERGVPMTAGTRTGNKAVQALEATTKNSPLGAQTAAEFNRGTETGLQRVGGELAQEVHPTPVTPESVGHAIPAQMDKTIAKLSLERDAGYEKAWAGRDNPAFDEEVPVRTKKVAVIGDDGNPTGFMEDQPVMEWVNMPVDVRAIKAAARPLIEEMQWIPAPERSASAGYTALQKIVKGDDFIPAWAAERGLSGLKSMAHLTAKEGVRDTGQGIAAHLIPDLQEGIDGAVAKGGPEAIQGLKAGRETHAHVMGVEEVAKQLRAQEPVQNFGRLVWPKDSGVSFLRQVQELAPEQMPAAGRAYVQQLVDKATREGGIGKTQGILNQWRDLGPETKKILYPDAALRANLDDFFKGLDMVVKNPNTSGTELVRQATSMNPARWAQGYIGSKLFYTPKGISLLTEGLQPKSPGAAALTQAKIRAVAAKAPPEEPPPGPPEEPPPAGGGSGAAALKDAVQRNQASVAARKAKLTGEAPATAPEAPAKPGALGRVSDALQEHADAAIERMRQRGTFKGTQMNALVPVNDLADMAIWGAAKIAKGTVDFAKWSKEMIADAGPAIKPHLEKMWADAQKIYARRVAETAGNMPTTKRVLAMYKAGKLGEDWYKHTQTELEQHFGPDAPMFVDMLAATSPNNTVEGNVTMALKAYTQYKTGQPFKGYMPAVIGNLEKVVKGISPSGPKVSSFKANLFGDPDRVTVDRWIARAMGRQSDNLTAGQYKFLDYQLTQLAKKAGVEPRQMQAAIWRAIKDEQGRAGNTNESFEQVLQRHVATKPDLARVIRQLREAQAPLPQ